MSSETPQMTFAREMLVAFLERLHETGALSVPPEDLSAAVDDQLEEET